MLLFSLTIYNMYRVGKKSWKRYGFTLIIQSRDINITVCIFFSENMYNLLVKISIIVAFKEILFWKCKGKRISFYCSQIQWQNLSYFLFLHVFLLPLLKCRITNLTFQLYKILFLYNVYLQNVKMFVFCFDPVCRLKIYI